MELRLSELLSSRLADFGIRRVYGCPGTTELGFVDALVRGGIEYCCVLHDTVALGMADGYARASGGLAVVNLHASQGSLNAAGFVRVALRDNVPLLIIAGLPSTKYDVYEPNHYLQHLEQCMTAITKWSWFVSNPNSIFEVLSRAVARALTPPRGPCFIGIPQDLFESTISIKDSSLAGHVPALNYEIVPSSEQIKKAATALANSENPTVFAGFGSQSSVRWTEPLALLVGAPVIAESLDRGTQIHGAYTTPSFPLFLGYLDSRDGAIASQIARSDVIVFVGTKAAYRKVLGTDLSPKCKVIHLCESADELGKDFRVDFPLVGHFEPTIKLLFVETRSVVRRTKRQGAIDTRRNRRIQEITDQTSHKSIETSRAAMAQDCITGQQLVTVLNDCLPANTVLVDDSQSIGYYVKHAYKSAKYHTIYGSLAGHLGWGLPAALGIKHAYPSRPVVCLVGDGGFMFGLQALAAATRHRISILVVIGNNRGHLSLQKELAVKFNRDSPALSALSLEEAAFDYAGIAESFGLKSETVTDISKLNAAIKSALREVKRGCSAYVVEVQMSNRLADWDTSWLVA